MLYDIMGRQILQLGWVVGLLYAGFTPAFAEAARPPICNSPKVIGGWIGDADRVTNEVRTIDVMRVAATGQVVGWFYQLQDGKLFFQPAFAYGRRIKADQEPTPFIVVNERTGGPATHVSAVSVPAAIGAIRAIVKTFAMPVTALPEPFSGVIEKRLRTTIVRCR